MEKLTLKIFRGFYIYEFMDHLYTFILSITKLAVLQWRGSEILASRQMSYLNYPLQHLQLDNNLEIPFILQGNTINNNILKIRNYYCW